MSNLNLNIDTIIKLADFGLRVGSAIVERRAGKPIATMTEEEINASIDSWNIHTDDAIARGEERARAGKVESINAPKVVSPPRIDPRGERQVTDKLPTPKTDTLSGFEDEGDDQGSPI